MTSTTTPFFFKPSNDHHQPPNPTTTKPDSTPAPKPRSRRGGRSQKGPNKIAQRGMGVERLEQRRLEIERLVLEKELQNNSISTTKLLSATISPNNNNNISKNINNLNNNNNNNNNNNVGASLAGVPVHPYPVTLTHFYFPGQAGPLRVGPIGPEALELPSMPNLFLHDSSNHTVSYKKKRVIVNSEDENEGIGFGKGKEKQHPNDFNQNLLLGNYHGVNFGGLNYNNIGHNFHHIPFNNGAFPGYNHDFTAANTEEMGIDTKWSMSRSNVMEYGFFPGKPDTANEEEIKNYYYKTMDNLDLKLGCSDYSSYASSPSSSSLTTVTNNFTAGGGNNSSDTSTLDLSLKLSNY